VQIIKTSKPISVIKLDHKTHDILHLHVVGFYVVNPSNRSILWV
jgi:hypothetical protein